MFRGNRLEIMKEPSQAQFKTNDDEPKGETHRKSCLFPKDMSELSTGSLNELCEAIDRSGCKPYTPEFRAGAQEENIHSSRPAVKVAGNFDEFQECIIWLINELRIWKDRAALESEKRRQVEAEVGRLKKNVQEAQMDNQKLERHVQEWKQVAEQARSRVAKYCQGVDEIWTVLEELKAATAMHG
jgi:hypothetical protein